MQKYYIQGPYSYHGEYTALTMVNIEGGNKRMQQSKLQALFDLDSGTGISDRLIGYAYWICISAVHIGYAYRIRFSDM